MYGAATSGFGRVFNRALLCAVLVLCASTCSGEDTFLVLCYHDIPVRAQVPEDISRHHFVNQMEFLHTNGYTVVSPDDILAARNGGKPLPEKAVLLTFDDAYDSFYDFVYPVLQRYNYPSVLSVVTSWIEGSPGYANKKMMTWQQIRDVARSGRVWLASHTHDSHRAGPCNPQGNVEPRGSTFLYRTDAGRYETDAEFTRRITTDLQTSLNELEKQTGARPWILTWPYGEYNQLGVAAAEKLGFRMILTLSPHLATIQDLTQVNRNIVMQVMKYDDFTTKVEKRFAFRDSMRAVQLDLDLIVNPDSPEESDRNLGLLIERLLKLGVNTVMVQAFCDRAATGNIRSVYFANSVLPVEMDFLSHVVNRIRIRGIQVYVWMPVLSFELPDAKLNERLKVRQWKDGRSTVSSSWYRRLSPFAPESLETIQALYRDLAARVRFDGILFQDDAYLNDFEDVHPAAMAACRERFGPEVTPEKLRTAPLLEQWTEMKTARIDAFIHQLSQTVHRYRPLAKTARNIYSEPVLNLAARTWFCQDYARFLQQYDYTVVMAYPRMEGLRDAAAALRWLEQLIGTAAESSALDQTIFKLQAFDWEHQRPVPPEQLRSQARVLVANGARHLSYYPDNAFEDQPRCAVIAPIFSSRHFPSAWSTK